LQHFFGSFSAEQVVSRQHFVENAAQTEHVRRAGLSLLFAGQISDFRREEAGCPTAKIKIRQRVSQCGKSKIDNNALFLALRCPPQHYVVWLEVPVNDSFAFHLRQGQQQLPHELFLSSHQRLTINALLESALKVLHFEVEGFFCLKLVVKGNDMRTVQPTHQVQLIQIPFFRLIVALKSLLLKTLQSKSRLEISHSLVHLRKGTLADLLERGQHFLQAQHNALCTERPKNSLQIILALNDHLNRGIVLGNPHDKPVLGRWQYFGFDHFERECFSKRAQPAGVLAVALLNEGGITLN
jgi:hypothetical protein